MAVISHNKKLMEARLGVYGKNPYIEMSAAEGVDD
jgi:hypothetical protein